MIPFPTAPEEVAQIKGIAAEMVRADIDFDWVAAVAKVARADQGAFDLMKLWQQEDDKRSRAEIVADLQETLDDYADAPPEPLQKPKIPFDHFDRVVKDVLAEKRRLKELVERHGGVSAVAKKSGIPQPSLSRMLNSASMPRKSTLYKIAVALGIPEKDVVMEWNR
jgi:hypothetical protein